MDFSRRNEVCVTSYLLSEELNLYPHTLLEMESKTFAGSIRDLAKGRVEDCITELRSPDAMSDSDKYGVLRELMFNLFL